MKKTLITCALGGVVALATPTLYAAQTSHIAVVTEPVQVHQASQSLTLVGKLAAKESVMIASEVTGRVNMIAVRENQDVTKGQLLIHLDDDKARAAQAEAQAYLSNEQRKLREFERLVKRNAVTLTELDAQKSNVAIAQARLNAEKANLKDRHISAPFAGTVGFLDFSIGRLVNAGDELLSLDDLSKMQLDLQVPERYLEQIHLGMEVKAKTAAWGDRTFIGQVIGVDTRINPETLNLKVRIYFDNSEKRLKPGMLMSANLTFPAIEAPIIPVQALQYAGTRRYVYVVDEHNKARQTEVFLGARIGNQVVIEKGLAIGERIVVQGVVNMRNGVAVKEIDSQSVSGHQPSAIDGEHH